VAPFTLFDFQRRVQNRYSFMPANNWRRRIQLINRFLLIAFLCGGVYWFFSDRKPSHPGPADVSLAQDSSSEDSSDTTNGEESGEDDEDTSPVVDEDGTPVDTMAEVLPGQPMYQRDSLLGLRIDQLLRQYKPHAAFYLVVDAHSNEILAWGGRSDSSVHSEPEWLSRATFPAASLIKMLTSVSALESSRFSTNTEIPLIGRSTTLYSRQLKIPDSYKGPTITLEDAFAKSCNPAMGIIGKQLGGKTLRKFAQRLGFNRPFPVGAPQPSCFVPPDTGYELAEAASGFTRKNTVSPLHIAAIVRALLEQTSLQIPWSHTIPAKYAPREPIPLDNSEFHPDTYFAMRQLFLRTISNGTARKQMTRTVYAVNREALIIGGKTGSLDGDNPAGRYDWFAGFAQSKTNPQKAIVIVVMQVHVKIRTLPSPAIAGLLINQWSRETFGTKDPAPRVRRHVKAKAPAKAKSKSKKK